MPEPKKVSQSMMMSAPRKRIVIVGGVAGGVSAATRARRLSESAGIVLLERGPYVSFANCGLPYHIGGAIEDRKRLLVQTPDGLYARYDIDVRIRTEVVAIDREAREVVARDLREGREYREPYDALVLSPGAEPVRPPIPGIGDPYVFTLRDMRDMDAISQAVDTVAQKRAVVVGAGYIGLEMVEAFRRRGMAVTLVEKLDHVIEAADPEMMAPLHAELLHQGVDLRLGTTVVSFERHGDRLEVVLSGAGADSRTGDAAAGADAGAGPRASADKRTGAGQERIVCGMALLAVGVRPDTKLAREAGLELGPTGAIRVDDRMRTSDPCVWAVGDAVEVRNLVLDRPGFIPLAGPANRQGRIAAENILGRESRYKGTQGTAICKVFDLAFAMTGATESSLLRAGQGFRRIYIHPADHAAYYPGAHPIAIKLLFDPADGRILGAQAVGIAGVDKRIDVLAVAIRAGMTVYDLEDLELCYAPPFGSAKDAVNMAGFVASNVLRSDVALWEPEELAAIREDQLLLDVRTFPEHADGAIPGAVCAPLDELRDRIEDLPRDKELLIFCQVGLRGYVAARLLTQHGFRARNLSGGYKRYQMWKGEISAATAPEDEVPEE